MEILFKDIWAKRKFYSGIIIIYAIALLQVLLVSCFSDNIKAFFHQELLDTGLNVSVIQFAEISNKKIDKFILDNNLKQTSYVYIETKDNYDLVYGENSLANLFNLQILKGDFCIDDYSVVLGSDALASFNYPDVGDKICLFNKEFTISAIISQNKENFLFSSNKAVYLNQRFNKANYKQLAFFTNKSVEQYLIDNGYQDKYVLLDSHNVLSSFNLMSNLVDVIMMSLCFITILIGLIASLNHNLTILQLRMKEIGIKKSLGAKDSDIFHQFVIETSIILFSAISLSLSICLIVIFIVNIMIDNKIDFYWCKSLLIILVFSILGYLTNFYPMLKASKITIIESIKKSEW